MRKTRHCVVISPNEMNKHLQTIGVAPITSSSKPTQQEFTSNSIKQKSG
jgi:mRNA interferase MazF